MFTFYADNFRGFTDTYIDLGEVNFFVGENSSGKTSILTLMRFLSQREFWFGLDVPNRIGLGHFEDAVSIHGKNRSSFRIGVVFHGQTALSAKPAAKQAKYAAALLTFRNSRGLPDLHEFTTQVGDTLVHIEISKGKIASYTQKNAALPKDLRRPFSSWNVNRLRRSSPKIMKGGSSFIPLPILFMVATTDAKSKERPALEPSEIVPWAARDLVWLAPIRTKPKRTYDEYRLDFSDEGEHTPYLIRKLLSTRSQAAQFQKFIGKFGRESGLFESVRIRRHGSGETAPFELDIVLSSQALGVNNVGYGVSQSLPIVVELFARPRHSEFAIQQPEVHLHPAAQAALGEALFDVAAAESKRFCIETHSDYLIDRFRLRQRHSKRKVSSRILYFSRRSGGNLVTPIEIGDDGLIAGSPPPGYRDFFVNEAMRLLELA